MGEIRVGGLSERQKLRQMGVCGSEVGAIGECSVSATKVGLASNLGSDIPSNRLKERYESCECGDPLLQLQCAPDLAVNRSERGLSSSI